MVTPEDFSSAEFMLGEVYGERSWAFRDGKLLSPSYPCVWDPEHENESRCLAGLYNTEAINTALRRAGLLNPHAVVTRWNIVTDFDEVFNQNHFLVIEWRSQTPAIPRKSRKWYGMTRASMKTNSFEFLGLEIEMGRLVLGWHEAAEILYENTSREGCNYVDCKCGYYAFTAGDNEYQWGLNRVTGIVKGYGETIIGDRGFRAKKSKVVALAAPRDPADAAELALQMDFPTMIRNSAKVWAYRKPERDWMSILSEAFPSIPVFANVDVMRAEFPTTDLTEYLPEKEESNG